MLPIFWSAAALDDLDEITDYIVVYEVQAGLIEVLAVLHARQEYPSSGT